MRPAHITFVHNSPQHRHAQTALSGSIRPRSFHAHAALGQRLVERCHCRAAHPPFRSTTKRRGGHPLACTSSTRAHGNARLCQHATSTHTDLLCPQLPVSGCFASPRARQCIDIVDLPGAPMLMDAAHFTGKLVQRRLSTSCSSRDSPVADPWTHLVCWASPATSTSTATRCRACHRM
jgi:hypothetical protein